MLSKLRTDIREKLRYTSHIFINGGMFEDHGSVNGNFSGHREIPDSTLQELGVIGVNSYIYNCRGNTPLNESDNVRIYDTSPDGIKSQLRQEGWDIGQPASIILAYEAEDLTYLGDFIFSFVPASAPLEVKMHSSYSSHNDGTEALIELCSLVISAKTYPYGYGK